MCKGEKLIEAGPQDGIENREEWPQRQNSKGKILDNNIRTDCCIRAEQTPRHSTVFTGNLW